MRATCCATVAGSCAGSDIAVRNTASGVLQAVRQLAQRLLVARLAHPLLVDQRVEVVGERGDLGGVAARDPRLLALLDAADLVDHAAQRRQAPLQQQRLRQQQ